jgi:hypothetical protein
VSGWRAASGLQHERHRSPGAEIVSVSSEGSTLHPSDVIACGTNHQQLGPLQDGETVEVEIDRVDRLQVSVRHASQRSWPKEVAETLARRLRNMRKAGSD